MQEASLVEFAENLLTCLFDEFMNPNSIGWVDMKFHYPQSLALQMKDA